MRRVLLEIQNEYNGVEYSIKRWKLFDGEMPDNTDVDAFGTWNYYLYIPVAQIPEEDRDRFLASSDVFRLSPESTPCLQYDYHDTDFGSLPFHGGITWYSIEGAECGLEWGSIKVGCDYAHYFDQDKKYTLESVQKEVCETIDELHKIVNLLSRCEWCGRYSTAEDLPNGRHVECHQERDEGFINKAKEDFKKGLLLGKVIEERKTQ
jgi:hypothetical protein